MAQRSIGELIEHNGKLAQYRGEYLDWDGKPWRVEKIAVSREPLYDGASAIPGIKTLLGQVPWSVGGSWSGTVLGLAGNRPMVAAEDWPVIEVRTEIKRPRNGKGYGWYWSQDRREWVKTSR